VFEENVDVAAGGEEFFCLGGDLGSLLRGIVVFAEAGVDEAGGDDFGDLEFFGFGETQGDAVLFEKPVDLVGQPSLVAEFESATDVLREFFEERLERGEVAFEIRRQLEQHRSQAAGGAKRIDGSEESLDEFGFFQAKNVGDALVRFAGEDESVGCGGHPIFKRRGGGEMTKSVIDFDGVEARGVVAKKAFLRELGGIEIGFPARVSESRSAGKKGGHGK